MKSWVRNAEVGMMVVEEQSIAVYVQEIHRVAMVLVRTMKSRAGIVMLTELVAIPVLTLQNVIQLTVVRYVLEMKDVVVLRGRRGKQVFLAALTVFLVQVRIGVGIVM